MVIKAKMLLYWCCKHIVCKWTFLVYRQEITDVMSPRQLSRHEIEQAYCIMYVYWKHEVIYYVYWYMFINMRVESRLGHIQNKINVVRKLKIDQDERHWALAKCIQFPLHQWHLSCYSCYKSGDKSCKRKGDVISYDKQNIAIVICDMDVQ